MKLNFFCRSAPKFFINWCYHFWLASSGKPKVLKITSKQYLCNISRKNWIMKLMFCMLINMKVFYKLILLFLIVLARHAHNIGYFASLQYLCAILRKNLWMKLRTTGAGVSNTACMIYYTSKVLLLLNLFSSQYGIHIELFIQLIVFVT